MLAEARENFKKNLVMYRATDLGAGGGDSALEKTTKAAMVAVLVQMRAEAKTQ